MRKKDLSFSMDNIKSIMKSMARHFGADCEIVLHDFTQGYEHSVVEIENGGVTGRGVGSSITNSGLEALTGDQDSLGEGMYNNVSNSSDGKIIRSSTALLRDKHGNVFGSVCINQDISRLCQAEQVLHSITHMGVDSRVQEIFVKNVDELLDHYLLECAQLVGRAPTAMNKEEVARSMEFLEGKGVFRIKKAGDHVCEAFGITKYQLYHHLDGIRGKGGEEEDAPA